MQISKDMLIGDLVQMHETIPAMLMKAGMSDVVRDFVERGVKHAAVINWDEPSPAKAFKVPRQDMKAFLGTNRDIRILELYKRLNGRTSLDECA